MPANPDRANVNPASLGGSDRVSSAEDGTSADLILQERPSSKPQAPVNAGGNYIGREHDETDSEEWEETPGGTLLDPASGSGPDAP